MKNQTMFEKNLHTYFDIQTFRPGQKEIIKDVLNGQDVLGILPTGSGKSLCYQLPAISLEGATIVVSPLISLMQDQVKQLKAIGFKAVTALNSFMESVDRMNVFRNLEQYKLIYVSPELLLKENMLTRLRQIKISLFVIDEAHCISQWGHEFRPDYLRLNSAIKQLNNPPVLALSATATEEVQEDIITSLDRDRNSIIKHIHPMDRENIAFSVHRVAAEREKGEVLIDLFNQYRVPTLVYFSSKRKSEEIALFLSQSLPSLRVAFYHGGMEQSDRVNIQQQFMNDQLDIICCTSAFGMGINKQNIRLVVHYHFPMQIESYIQEVGRAGRDGKSSVGLLLYAPGDEQIPGSIIKNELPSGDMLNTVFLKLHQLYRESSLLSTVQQENESDFQVNEIQWRFLHDQFKKHGMINGNQIMYNEKQWNQAFNEINHLIKNRIYLKKKKLDEMKNWINEQECLRKHLYKSFQHSYKEPVHNCCSNCGFSFHEWTPVQTELNDRPITWQTKLRKVFLIGDSDEETN